MRYGNQKMQTRYGIPLGGPEWLKWEKDYARRKAAEAIVFHGPERCLARTTEIVSTDIEPDKHSDMFYLLCAMIQFKAMSVYRLLQIEPKQDDIETLVW